MNQEVMIEVDKYKVGDKWHSIGELYDHREALYLMLVAQCPLNAWMCKSMKDGEECEPGWIIVGLETPCGQISYHVSMALYKWLQSIGVREVSESLWDGHDSFQVLDRLSAWMDRVSQLEQTWGSS